MDPMVMLLIAITVCLACGLYAVMLPQFSTTVRLPASEVAGRRPNPLLGVVAQVGGLLARPKGEQGSPSTEPVFVGSSLTVVAFRGLKILLAIGGCLAAALIASELGGLPPFLPVLAGAIGFVLPNLWLRSQKAKRERAILRLLPEVVDLLNLCIGAGLDFLLALQKVVAVKRDRREPLIEELGVTIQEIKLGKRRGEALRAMGRRVNLPEIASFVRTVVQADRMGTPLIDVLTVHADDVRTQRLTRAERAALQAPIKILFPLIFFIMPCVAIIVGAPVFIQFMTQSPFSR